MQDSFNKESENWSHLSGKEKQKSVSTFSVTNILKSEIFENMKSLLLDKA